MNAVLFVNRRCNKKCRHCYLSYEGERSPEYSLALTRHLRGQGHEITIAGSESLLDMDYLKSYKEVGQDYILTNGIILDRDKSVYELLRKHGIKTVVLSMHSAVQKDIKSVSKKLVERVICEAKVRGFRVKVFTLITSKNYDSLADLCERAVELGIDELQPVRFTVTGRARVLKEMALSEDQLARFFEDVLKVRAIYPKSVLDISPHGNFGPRYGSKGELMAKENRYCPAGVSEVEIDPHDNVYACPFLMQLENRIGVYRDGEIIIERDLLDGRRDTCIAHLI